MRKDDTLTEKAEFFAALNGFRAAAGTEFVEDAAAMSLHGVFTHEKSLADLAVAQAAGNELKNFHFAGSDAEALASGIVGWEIRSGDGGNRDFDDAIAGSKQRGSEP